MTPWKPGATVAAVIEQDGRYLVVREHTRQGVRINQPAGHLEPGESLEQAVVRETLEETPAMYARPRSSAFSWLASPGLMTVRMSPICASRSPASSCRTSAAPTDAEIIEPVWMTPAELRDCEAVHRSRLVLETLDAHLAGHAHPLSLLHTELHDVRVR